MKLTAFSDFVSDKNKLVTTFNEKTSAKRNISIGPRELRKFHDLHILDVATGLEHILLFAISKSNIYTSLDISSSDPNENISVKETPPKVRRSSISGAAPPIPRKNSKSLVVIPSPEIVPESRVPSLTKQTLESIYTDTPEPEKKPEEKPPAKQKSPVEPKPDPEPISKQVKLDDVVKLIDSQISSIDKESQVVRGESESLKEFEKLEMENSVGTVVAHVGDSIKTDVMSMVNSGKEQINEMKNDVVKTVTEIPQHMTDYTKTTIVPKIDEQIKHVSDTKNEIMDGIFDEVKQSKQFLKQSIAKKLSIDSDEAMKSDDGKRQVEKTKEFLNDNMNEMDQILRSDKIKQELEKDEKIEVLVDAEPQNDSHAVEDPVKFIDNGVDVSNTSDIIQSMKEEIKEMDAEAEDQVMEIKDNFESNFLGEKLSGPREAFVDTMTKTKNGKCRISNFNELLILWPISDSNKAMSTVTNSVPYKHIPLKYDLEEVDLEGDGDTERTTASIKSANTPTKNPFDGDDIDDIDTMPKKEEMPPATKESSGDGRVKRFLNEIKSNCKTADTVVESELDHLGRESWMDLNTRFSLSVEHSAEQYVKSHSIDDIIGDNKASKVCTIL